MAVRISLLLAAEATRDMPTQRVRVQTPLGPADGRRVTDGVVVVPVLRAGLGMLDAVLELIPTARVGHIGLQRDEMTAVASQYYSKLPPDLSGSFVLMIDPMLATGGSAVAALDLIRSAGGRDVRMICIVAAPEGIALVEQHHPDVHIYTPVIDEGSTRTSSSCPASATSATGLYGTVMTSMKPRRANSTPRPSAAGAPRSAAGTRRRVAHGADVHRAEQDPRARLPARRDDGTADVRRSDLSAAHRRAAVARDRPADGSAAGVVHRSRRDAAVDAGGAQHGDDRRAAAGCVAAGMLGFGPLSRRRHRVRACSFSTAGSRWCARARAARGRRAASSQTCVDADEMPPGFGHRFHTRDPRAARLFQMALELEVEGEHIQMIRAVELVLHDHPTSTAARCR